MDALKQTVSPSTTASITLFTGATGQGTHRVSFYNADDTVPAVIYLKVAEGSSNNQMILRKITLSPQTDQFWLGTIGGDDEFVVECHNSYQSTLVSTNGDDSITTEDGQQLGATNNMRVNYTWMSR